VAWIFDTRGVVQVEKSGVDEERLILVALEAGAEDVVDEGTSFEVRTDPDDLETVRDAIIGAGITPTSAEVSKIPSNYVTLAAEDAPKVLKLLDMLSDHDDVQHVHSNFDVPQEVLEKLGQ
jgi:transcriptional/translational regulatory protein YebC/TACO1